MRQVLLLQNNTHSEALRDGLEVRILVPLPPSLYMSRLIIYDTVPPPGLRLLPCPRLRSKHQNTRIYHLSSYLFQNTF